MSSHI